MRLSRTVAIGGLALLAACGDSEESRQELNKLRALGVSANPVVPAPGVPVTITIYAAVPLEETVAFSTFTDQASVLAPQVEDLSFIAGSEAYEDFAHFRLFSVQARFVVPPNEILQMAAGESRRLRYAVQLNSPGEEEKIVGDVVVRPAGAEELAWTAPAGEILSPATTDILRKKHETTIDSTIENPNGEELKIGWYVSRGEIKNRRAKSTKWTTTGDGEQTLVLTVRGKSSRGFFIKVIDYQAE